EPRPRRRIVCRVRLGRARARAEPAARALRDHGPLVCVLDHARGRAYSCRACRRGRAGGPGGACRNAVRRSGSAFHSAPRDLRNARRSRVPLPVRTVLCSSAFSLAPPLRSTNSAAAEAALFARFSATTGRADFSLALIVGYGLRPSRRDPGHDWWGQRWRSPGSRSKGFCACQGLRRRGAGSCLAMTTRTILPSVGRKTSAPRTCLTPLNT